MVTVLAAAAGGTPAPGAQELNLWGHPVDRLRYADPHAALKGALLASVNPLRNRGGFPAAGSHSATECPR